MPTFISTGRFSAEAAKGLVAKPEDRAKVVGKMMEAAGGKLLQYYFTTGDRDFLIIGEAKDGADAVAMALATASMGAVSDVQTIRAWTSAEFVSIAKKAGKLTKAYHAPGKG